MPSFLSMSVPMSRSRSMVMDMSMRMRIYMVIWTCLVLAVARGLLVNMIAMATAVWLGVGL